MGNVGPPIVPQQPNAPQQTGPPPISATQPPAVASGVKGPPQLPNLPQQMGPPPITATQPPAAAPGVKGPPQLPSAPQQAGPLPISATQPPAGAPGAKGPPQLPNTPLQPGTTNGSNIPSDPAVEKLQPKGPSAPPVTPVGIAKWGGGPGGAVENARESNRIKAELDKQKAVADSRQASLQRSADDATKAAIQKDNQDDQDWNRRSRR
jgi:hypothetical protein